MGFHRHGRPSLDDEYTFRTTASDIVKTIPIIPTLPQWRGLLDPDVAGLRRLTVKVNLFAFANSNRLLYSSSTKVREGQGRTQIQAESSVEQTVDIAWSTSPHFPTPALKSNPMNAMPQRATRPAPPKCLTLAICLALAASSIHRANAATYYWNTTTIGTISAGGSWSDNAASGGTTGVIPGANDTAVFSSTLLECKNA